jgi:hypothetical protein
MRTSEDFLDHAQAVENGGGADNRRTVLVIMEHGNVHTLAQLLLDVETFRRFDVFQVDTAEGRLQRGHHVDEFIGIELIHFDIEHVDTGEFLEQNPFPSITGLPASAPMLPSPSTAVPLEITATRLPRAVYL